MKSKNHSGFLFFYFLLALVLIGTAIALHHMFEAFFAGSHRTHPTSSHPVRQVILDAGHGGYDGGAVSLTGTAEKTLNLETTLTLSELLHLQGYYVLLTRDSDVELTAEGNGSRKMKDLKGRLQIAETNKDSPFISIHMNKFPQNQYRGLQVYYSTNHPQGQVMAESVQATVRDLFQKDNNRQIKPATSAIFLLHKITSPAILIECGFLSHPEEAQLLEDASYRTSLALCIAVGYDAAQVS